MRHPPWQTYAFEVQPDEIVIQSEHQRRAYLQALGIDVWVPAADLAAVAGHEPEAVAAVAATSGDTDGLDWTQLRARVATCTRCALHKSRTQTVFGVGNEHADWLIIGEAPGAEEDRRGEPFVGRAGQLLDEMLRAAGQARGDVFIANVLKCRPPNNRDPEAGEASACRGYLERQIALLKPKIILAVGRIAAQTLLNTDTPVGKLRGKLHHLGDIPLVVTYHPAFLLRSPKQKYKSWQDLCLAMDVIAGSAA